MSYWDTSCLLKLYVAEPDSALFEAHALAAHPLMSSEIARFELWTALRRKEAEGRIAPDAAAALFRCFETDCRTGEIVLVPIDEEVRSGFDAIVGNCHGQSPPIFIRTLDAIHLASARAAGEAEIVTTDLRLRDAAIFEGFDVFPPP
ncbi:MAG TPA: type II toxin-antitoxin system VapC family toxin [Bacteroidia bacterium]|nr:type II toxin-antitoxin system VapC family toxin [Bacteroidia bacterium]